MKYAFSISISEFKESNEQTLVKTTIFSLAQKSGKKIGEMFPRRPDPFLFRCVLSHEIPMNLVQMVWEKLPEDSDVDDVQFAVLNLLYDAERHFNEDWNDYYRLTIPLDNDRKCFDQIVKVQCYEDNQPESMDFGRRTAMLNFINSANHSDEEINDYLLTIVMNDSLGMNLAAYYAKHKDELPEDLREALENKAMWLRNKLKNDPYLLHFRRIQEKHEEAAGEPGFGIGDEECHGFYANHACSFFDSCVHAIELINATQSRFVRQTDLFAMSAENAVLGVRVGFQMRANLRQFYGSVTQIDDDNHQSSANSEKNN